VSYEDLGATAGISLDGNGGTDTVVVNGSSSDDDFTVSSTGSVDLQNAVGNHIDVTPTAVETLKMLGADGDDSFDVTFGQQGSFQIDRRELVMSLNKERSLRRDRKKGRWLR
jgi:hypothetical protein